VIWKRIASFAEVFRALIASDSVFCKMCKGLFGEFIPVLIPNISVDIANDYFNDIFAFRALCQVEIFY
jgi:hypothetical protein